MNPKKYRPFPQYVPTDGQHIYFVRFVRGGDGVEGWYHPEDQNFEPAFGGQFVPDYMVVEWRPAD